MGDYDKHIESIKKGQLLSEATIRELCDKAREILSEEQNVIRVGSPVTVNKI